MPTFYESSTGFSSAADRLDAGARASFDFVAARTLAVLSVVFFALSVILFAMAAPADIILVVFGATFLCGGLSYATTPFPPTHGV